MFPTIKLKFVQLLCERQHLYHPPILMTCYSKLILRSYDLLGRKYTIRMAKAYSRLDL